MLEEMLIKMLILENKRKCSPLFTLTGNSDITSNKKQTNNDQYNHL